MFMFTWVRGRVVGVAHAMCARAELSPLAVVFRLVGE